ncbi:hypothetical protein [Staphylococcus capitis]|uniref:hypothetical protein n=1 Tax=Staphylococcus capitis TaxID=29388 RepID=UPI00287AB061|nr:hypothetical protein [Staphylococcus capitis]MDS4034507.1 hypothetical protein [Staphylococcus capitis]
MEEEFNIEVIVRDPKHHSIDITEMGQVIINHTEIIENELREMTFDINRLKTFHPSLVIYISIKYPSIYLKII